MPTQKSRAPREKTIPASPSFVPCLIFVLLFALVLVISPRPGLADDAALPTAEEILDKAVEAMGGKAAIQALHNRVRYGTLEIRPMGIQAPITEYAARPNRSYVSINSPALGLMESGTVDSVAWELSSMQGPMIKEGAERADAFREADFDGLANWRKLYSKVECLGTDTIDGEACYKVVLTPPEGAADTSLFSPATGLPVQSRTMVETPMGTVPVTVIIEDYRTVAGVRFPFRVNQVVMNGIQEMEVMTDSIRVNVDLPDDRFIPPAEVRALLQKAGSGEAAPAGAPGEKAGPGSRTSGANAPGK